MLAPAVAGMLNAANNTNAAASHVLLRTTQTALPPHEVCCDKVQLLLTMRVGLTVADHDQRLKADWLAPIKTRI